ncbi:MAG: hypothetical protein U1F43_38375 [Myxococcota bacterium]
MRSEGGADSARATAPRRLPRVARWLPFLAVAFVLFAMGQRRGGAAEPDAGASSDAATTAAPATGGETAPSEPATPMATQHVKVGIYATAIPEIDIKSGTFTIDMYLWMVYAGADETMEAFEIANGEILSKALLERTTRDGKTYACWRIKATMHQHFSLNDYPFDRQHLEIHIEHSLLESSGLVYEPDVASYQRSGEPRARWGLRGDLEVAEYDVVGTEWTTRDSIYQTDFGSPFSEKSQSVYSNAVFSIDVARSFLPYCYKILIPLIVILAMAYLVFFLPPDEIQSASGLAMTSLLTCVAMNITVSSNLPEVGYLVASDKFFICTYVLIFVTLAETVWTYGAFKAGHYAKAERIERIFRWGFPVAFLLAFAYLGVAALT